MKEYQTNKETKIIIPEDNKKEQELAYKRFISVLSQIVIKHGTELEDEKGGRNYD